MGKIKRVVVDECLGKAPAALGEIRSRLANRPVEFLFLAREHPGIPDNQILDKLMDARTALLTRDRVLHNLALRRGFRSFMVACDGTIIESRLCRVSIPKQSPPASAKTLSESFLHRRSPDAQFIVGRLAEFLSEHQLKQFRTKRRRIRAHFGSSENIAGVALTIGHLPTADGVVGGYMLKIDGRQHVKTLSPASEGYFLDGSGADEPLQATCWALFHVLVLQLERCPITIYQLNKVALGRSAVLLADAGCAASPVEGMTARLFGAVPHVKVLSCVKGRFFNRANEKLNQLARLGSNELVPVDSKRMAATLSASDGSSSEPLPLPHQWRDEVCEDGALVLNDESWNQIPF